MKKLIVVLLLLFSSGLYAQFEGLKFGTDSTLEVLTWNIEHFPKNGQATLDYVVDIIHAIDPDVVAIQEVSTEYWFNQLIDALGGWDGYFAYDEYASMVFIYKTSVISNTSFYEIFKPNYREFPREPLVMEMTFKGQRFVLFNNHLKCCGDGYLNLNDDWDEEKRRYDACKLLDGYIEQNLPADRVILLGDLNDELIDNASNNVFNMFINDSANYAFADMAIAEGSSYNWSYPYWPSHIDHILVTNELFDEMANPGSETKTLRVDDYFDGGLSEYDFWVTDHRPVALKIKTNSTLGQDEHPLAGPVLTLSPNPANAQVVVSFPALEKQASIRLVDSRGVLVDERKPQAGQTQVVFRVQGLASGVYVVILSDRQGRQIVKKLIVNH